MTFTLADALAPLEPYKGMRWHATAVLAVEREYSSHGFEPAVCRAHELAELFAEFVLHAATEPGALWDMYELEPDCA